MHCITINCTKTASTKGIDMPSPHNNWKVTIITGFGKDMEDKSFAKEDVM